MFYVIARENIRLFSFFPRGRGSIYGMIRRLKSSCTNGNSSDVEAEKRNFPCVAEFFFTLNTSRWKQRFLVTNLAGNVNFDVFPLSCVFYSRLNNFEMLENVILILNRNSDIF